MNRVNYRTRCLPCCFVFLQVSSFIERVMQVISSNKKSTWTTTVQQGLLLRGSGYGILEVIPELEACEGWGGCIVSDVRRFLKWGSGRAHPSTPDPGGDGPRIFPRRCVCGQDDRSCHCGCAVRMSCWMRPCAVRQWNRLARPCLLVPCASVADVGVT